MLINKLKKERGFLVVVRVIPSLLRRIKNFYYSFVFGCNNLRVGCNCLLVGTKSIFIGDGVLVGNFNWLEALNGGCIYIGNNVSLSSNVHIAAAKEVSIGDGCLIGSDVLITDHNHVFGEEYNNTPPKLRGLEIKGNTVIGSNCWIGDNVKILSGVSLGCNVVVAANSVVTKSFFDDLIIGGVPARILEKNKGDADHEG